MSLDLDERRVAMLREMGIDWVRASVAVSPSDDAPRDAPPTATAATQQRAEPSRAVLSPVTSVAPAIPIARVEPAPACADAIEAMSWDELERAAAACTACALSQGRRGAIFGVGDRHADWLIVGEPPSEEEDLQGAPFAGPSGVLLDNMLRATGRSRQRGAYLSNIVKCRPPANRAPGADELAQCESFIARQVALLRPRVILALGRHAVQVLLRSDEPPGRLRGRIHEWRGVPVVVSFHPDYLRRNPRDKALAWADLCLARSVGG